MTSDNLSAVAPQEGIAPDPLRCPLRMSLEGGGTSLEGTGDLKADKGGLGTR